MNSKYTLSNDGNTGCPNRYQFQTQMKHKVEKIEGILTEYLPRQEGFQSVIMEAMSYSLMAGGKRLRPMLLNETYRLFGGEGPLIRPFMAAIEMIHTYSLVYVEGKDKKAIKSIRQVQNQDRLSIYVTDGILQATVEDVKEEQHG